MVDEPFQQRVGSLDLCIRDSGSGPAVVLLHGTTANLGVWDTVTDLLGPGIRTIAVDQRGHGRSDKPRTGYGAEEYSNDVAELIDVLDCGPAIIVGHSLGARNAVVLGARRPDLVTGIVAADYTPFIEQQVFDELRDRVAGGDRTFETQKEVVDYLHQRYPLLPKDAVERRARFGYSTSGEGIRPLAEPAAMAATVDGLRVDFVAAAKSVAAPVTLLRGESSRIVSEKAFAQTQRLRADFRALTVAGADHYIPEENPKLVADETRQMLTERIGATARNEGTMAHQNTTDGGYECP